jgi:histidyl-tRNA synthetase
MKIPSVKGFRDVIEDDGRRWEVLETDARRIFETYNFREIRIPIVERTELFRRSIGETTDIVEKEMYTFEDRDGTSLTLRPEGTASVVRAYVEHSLFQKEPVSKLYYFGPMFRRERPQKGRLRQFYQIGAEVLGRDDPAADAEMLFLLYDLLAAFQVAGAEVQINSLGCRKCRPTYRAVLVDWGRSRHADLCEDCRRRIDQNPLRLLDCKQPGCLALRDSAPLVSSSLCDECRRHFERVVELLDVERRRPRMQPHMVRGLDYYCRTAFEVIAPGLGAQSAIGGGGRYDGLVRDLGGPDVAGVGFALGMERLAMTLAQSGRAFEDSPEIVVLPVGAAAEPLALQIAQRLRHNGVRVELESGEKSLKSQMRRADKLGARYALIVGDDEIKAGALTVRDLRARRDHPKALGIDLSPDELRDKLTSL